MVARPNRDASSANHARFFVPFNLSLYRGFDFLTPRPLNLQCSIGYAKVEVKGLSGAAKNSSRKTIEVEA